MVPDYGLSVRVSDFDFATSLVFTLPSSIAPLSYLPYAPSHPSFFLCNVQRPDMHNEKIARKMIRICAEPIATNTLMAVLPSYTGKCATPNIYIIDFTMIAR